MSQCTFVFKVGEDEHRNKAKTYELLVASYWKKRKTDPIEDAEFIINGTDKITDNKSFQKVLEKYNKKEVNLEVIEKKKSKKSSKGKQDDQTMSSVYLKATDEMDQRFNECLTAINKLLEKKEDNPKLSQIQALLEEKMQSQSKSGKVTHPGIRCDNCSAFPIVGYRYKCTLDNCGKNANLCSKCFEENEDKPFDDHDFLEIRKPEKPRISLKFTQTEITFQKSAVDDVYKLEIINNSNVPVALPIKLECGSRSKIKFLATKTEEEGTLAINEIAEVKVTFKTIGRKDGVFPVFVMMKDKDGNQIMEDQELTVSIVSTSSSTRINKKGNEPVLPKKNTMSQSSISPQQSFQNKNLSNEKVNAFGPPSESIKSKNSSQGSRPKETDSSKQTKPCVNEEKEDSDWCLLKKSSLSSNKPQGNVSEGKNKASPNIDKKPKGNYFPSSENTQSEIKIDNSLFFLNETEEGENELNDSIGVFREDLKRELKRQGINKWISERLLNAALDNYDNLRDQIEYIKSELSDH